MPGFYTILDCVNLPESLMDKGKEPKRIDLENILRSKNPRLLKFLPGFVLRYIKRVIHQDQVNSFLAAHGDKYDFAFVDEVLKEFQVKVNSSGDQYIPASGGFIMASNHPMGGLDAMALLQVVGKKRKDLKFIVNDILLQLENLKGLFTGVNKHGKNPIEMLEAIELAYGSGQGVLIYPAGLVSRKQGGIIKDLDWKKSFITKAKKHQLPVIPVFVEGRNSNFFYRLANWRKRLGIKANIEMLYLVDEMYYQENKTISVIFGEPISWERFDKSKSDSEWAAEVKEEVYLLSRKN